MLHVLFIVCLTVCVVVLHVAGSIGWSVLSHGNFALVRMAIAAGFDVRGCEWVQEFLQGKPGRRRWYTSNDYR